MDWKVLFTTSSFLKGIFGLSFLILFYISFVTYRHTTELTNSTALVVHTYDVNVELEQLISYIKDAETDQRGFLLTQDSIFLESYMEANGKVNQSFSDLKNLISDNLAQQANLDSLYDLIGWRFMYLQQSLEMNKKSINTQQRNAYLLDGKEIMDKIRRQVDHMIGLELTSLKEHRAKYESAVSFTPLFTLLLLLFSLTAFTIAYLKVLHDFKKLSKANEALMIKNEFMNDAEQIGAFSTWQWDLERNKLYYSDNQYRLLGCLPQSFEATVDNYLPFIHPDDLHIALQRTEEIQGGIMHPVFFRIIRKDGEVRYFNGKSKILRNAQGQRIAIGINTDITESRLSSLALEEKNQALLKSNKELNAFNHIASHDLQEPLRKIQTFISLIVAKERDSLSQMAKNYLERIQVSATRMRALIDDLLLFSSTNKTENTFKMLDLNDLLRGSEQELAEEIEDKKAVIESAHLPTLSVISFQISQLFINLISNSLKYSDPERPPHIKITYAVVKAEQYPTLGVEPTKAYHEITFKDNGLGFDQQYADSIFNLFQRLHHKNDYPGTGIGLAICKKIMENHGGHITAESVLGEGADFKILLPVFSV